MSRESSVQPECVSLPCSAAPGRPGRGSANGLFPELCHSASPRPRAAPPQGPPCFLSGPHHCHRSGGPAVSELRTCHCEDTVGRRQSCNQKNRSNVLTLRWHQAVQSLRVSVFMFSIFFNKISEANGLFTVAKRDNDLIIV